VGNIISFELFEYIDPLDCAIIFLCVHKEFAFQAVQYGAVAYILKPVDNVELISALDRAIKLVRKRKMELHESAVAMASSGIIHLYENHARRSINTRSLVKMRADGSYSWACLEGGKTIHLSRHLKYYENMLKEYGFIRTHKTLLANPLHIVEYINGNNPMIKLSDGSMEPLSRSKRIEIMNFLSQNIGLR
jgi:two-component system, LytTR family, response regulator